MPQLHVRKPKAILFDVNGTVANTTFVSRILSGYLRRNIKPFLASQWTHPQLQRDIGMMRGVASAHSDWPQIAPATESPEVVQQSVETLVLFCLDRDIDFLPFAQLRYG